MINQAVKYAALSGMHVFPVHTIRGGVCSCGNPKCKSPGKHPIYSGGHNKATLDAAQIGAWWTSNPDANIGHRPAEGYAVVDVDGKRGADTLAALIAEHGPLPETSTGVTGGGGRHIYFKCDRPLTNGSNLLPGIDVRTNKGYVLLPPSLHISGNRYEWLSGQAPWELQIADMPDRLYTALSKNSENDAPRPRLEVPEEIPDGQRNDTLFRAACRLREFGHTETEIYNAIAAMNEGRCNPPMSDDEIKTICRQAASYPIGKMIATAARDFTGVVSANGFIDPLSDKRRYTFNDRGNGFLFADLTANFLRYCPQAKNWSVYRGGKWGPDVGDAVARECAKNMSDYLFGFISGTTDTDREAYRKNAGQLYNLAARERMLRDAQSVNPLLLEELDTNTDLFNLQNGTLNLITGAFNMHNAADLISKKAGAAFVPGADCPLWKKTLAEIFEGKADLIRYFQKVLGYSLLGKPIEKQFYLLHGAKTNNGKTTVTHSIRGGRRGSGCVGSAGAATARRED